MPNDVLAKHEFGVQGYHAHQRGDNFCLCKLCVQEENIFPVTDYTKVSAVNPLTMSGAGKHC
jgi:hypothetical protein